MRLFEVVLRIVLAVAVALGLVVVGEAGSAEPNPALVVPAQANCSPAYPDFCIPPPPPNLTCEDAIVPFSNFTVRAPDPHRFDDNEDGRGCENSSKPRFQRPVPTTTTSTTQATTTTTTRAGTATTAPTTTTAAGMPNTGVDTDRRVIAAAMLICLGVAMVLLGSGRPKLRMD
jgi:hypothetical protein